MWLLILGLAVAIRGWRLEAIGEGVDEGYSVMTTRVMAEGRFTWSQMNDYRHDAYAAKFQPVAEAIAVPFLWLLGDRPLAFRLPWLLASLALLVWLMRYAGRRYGRTAAIALGVLYALDYRNAYYSQTHRYVVATQLFAFLTYLATCRAMRIGRWTSFLPVVVAALLLIHSHLMGVWVLLGLFLAVIFPQRTADGSRPRSAKAVLVLGGLLAYAGLMMVCLRASSGPISYLPGGEGLSGAIARSGLDTVRMVFGLGIAAAPLAALAIPALKRSRNLEDRAILLVGLAAALLWFPVGLAAFLEPRYAACVQPFVFLAAAVAAGRLIDRWALRPRLRIALAAVALLLTAAPTAWYAATGGARDAEDRLLVALRKEALPGDVVLYDVGAEDPFGRRPRDLVSAPRSIAWEADAARRVETLGVRWIVRSSLGSPAPLYTPAFDARLEEVAREKAQGLLLPSSTLTLFRVRPVRPVRPPE